MPRAIGAGIDTGTKALQQSYANRVYIRDVLGGLRAELWRADSVSDAVTVKRY